METTHRLDITDLPNIQSLRRQFDGAMSCLLNSFQSDTNDDRVSPSALADSMQHFFNILDTIDRQRDGTGAGIDQSEVTDIANHGLRLLNELCVWAGDLACEESYYQLEQLSLPIAYWAARYGLTLTELEIITNAISHIANNTQDTRYLSRLAELIEQIIESIASEIKRDADKSNPARPWRVLNLNHGIIATRSLDPKRMEAVFEQLIYRLPDDAAGFFAEGMEQMDIIDYPDHVRSVMQTYYRLTNQPTLH